MKRMKKFATVLQVIGIVALCLGLVLSIYNLAAGGARWGEMSAQLAKNGVGSSLVTRIRFDRALYGAMSGATDKTQSTGVRAAAVQERFAFLADAVAARAGEVQKQKVEEVYAYYENEFDAAAYAKEYEAWQDSVELRQINEAIAALDELAQPAGKPGKKMPKLKTVSCQEFMEGYYAALSAEHGEEAGSYLDFLLTVKELITQAKDGGAAVSSASDYVQASFDYEAYLPVLAQVQAEERIAESGFLDDFAAVAEAKAAGSAADFRTLFENAYATLHETYPEDAQPDYLTFLLSLRAQLESGVTFDGSYATIRKAVQAAQQETAAVSFPAFLSTFSRNVVGDVDSAGNVPAFRLLWAITAQSMLFWLAGIVLVAAALIIKKGISALLLKRLEKAGIEEQDDVLLRVNHLKQYFRSGDYVNKAVDDVSFYIKKGEVFGLVGESGCGKTTTGRTIINLYDPTEGDVYFQGLRISSTQNGLPVLIRQMKNEAEGKIKELATALKEQCAAHPEKKDELTRAFNQQKKEICQKLHADVEKARENALESSVEKSKCVEKYREKRKAELTAEYEADMKTLTGEAAADRKRRYETEMKVAARDNIMTRMQMIFQDPIASINPRMTVREIIAEGLIIRGIKDKKYIDEKVYEMLDLVGLVPEHADRYPHEFSGGQRQRIGIARAIAMQPDLIIADEPISALDVSIQAQVINLLNDLRNRMGLTILFIAHNLSVVKYFSDRIAVMYFGKIVEMATSDELFEHPLHPYTKSLLSAIPYPDPHYEKQRKRIEYNPAKSHDYSVDKPSMREIVPGHFIYCNDAELARYQEELKQ